MRGTLLSVPDDDVHYLYTSGYVPEETTYQGSGVPSPIEIRPDEICETPSLEICKEILFFHKTRLEYIGLRNSDASNRECCKACWRTILSEVDTESISEVRPQYFYYM